MKIGEVPRKDKASLSTVAPGASIKVAIDILSDRNVGALPVCDTSNKIVGIISERDIVRWLAENPLNFEGVTVSDMMTSDVVTCTDDYEVVGVMTLMNDCGIRHMPVVADDKLVGMVSSRDILQSLLEDMNAYATKMTLNYEIMR